MKYSPDVEHFRPFHRVLRSLTRTPMVLRYRTVVLSLCLSVCLSCPVCNVGVLWPNGWMDQDESWHAGMLGPGHIVLDGDPSPPPQRGTAPPNFRPISVVVKWLDGSRWHLAWR